MGNRMLKETAGNIAEAAKSGSKEHSHFEKVRAFIKAIGSEKIIQVLHLRRNRDIYSELEDEKLRTVSFLAELSKLDLEEISTDEILQKVERQMNKDNMPSRSARVENISFGIEIEIGILNKSLGALDKDKRLEAIHALQSLGIPLGSDASVEIQLPYSLQPNEQLRAILILIKLKLIHPTDKLTTHINTGGIEANLFKNLDQVFMIQIIMDAVNLFGRVKAQGVFKQSVEKAVIASNDMSSKGYPFVIKDEHLVEWRSFGFVDFQKMSKGTLTLNSLMEASASYMRKNENLPMNEQQEKLAVIWENFLKKVGKIMDKYRLHNEWTVLPLYSEYILKDAQARPDYISHPEGTKSEMRVIRDEIASLISHEDFLNPFLHSSAVAKSFSRVRTRMNRASHDKPRFRNEMMRAVIHLRKQVRAIAQEA